MAFETPVFQPPRGSEPESQISLWSAVLDLSAPRLEELSTCLSPEERRRADLLRHSLDRQRFLAARGWLRHLLATQLDCAPAAVPIVQEEHGKPRLVGGEIRFNASRSAGLALYATSRSMEVGVDVEAIREDADMERIAARFFSKAEQRALAALPREGRLVAGFQCWTCKEAFVKGIGVGISFPLASVDTWAGSSQPAVVSEWWIHQIDAGPGFAAAVAGDGLGQSVPSAPIGLTH